jgi:mannose-6-phosphate isomerase-like protein (cupin superfamily)
MDQLSVLIPFADVPDQRQMRLTPGGATMLVSATGSQTGNSASVVEFTFPAGVGFPMHIHHREDELLYILEGTLIVVQGNVRSEVQPGSLIYGPRLTPHGFRASDAGPVRFVETFLPSGLEQYFLAVSVPLTDQAAAGAVAPPSTEVLLKEAGKYGIEIVGPIPA